LLNAFPSLVATWKAMQTIVQQQTAAGSCKLEQSGSCKKSLTGVQLPLTVASLTGPQLQACGPWQPAHLQWEAAGTQNSIQVAGRHAGYSAVTIIKPMQHRRCRSDASVTGDAGDVCPGVQAFNTAQPSTLVSARSSGHRRCRSDGNGLGGDVDALWRIQEAKMAAIAEAGIDAPKGKPKLSLPSESRAWTRLETDLYLLSGCVYHPGIMAQLRRLQHDGMPGTGVAREVTGRVSIVSPTMSSRQHYHEQLWACFEAQTWEDKELIVVETYEESPSEFLQLKAKEDRRLVHVCFKRPPGEDFSVGLKRNMTLHLASGQFIVNFDDDDIYAASYVSKAVGELQNRGLAALTFSSWYNYFAPTRVCGYSDPDSWGQLDNTQMDEVLYGYGFSYVHRRRASLLMPYPDVTFAEDAPFFLRLRNVLGADKVALWKDTEGICMHIVHRGNSTGVDGVKFTSELEQEEFDRLAVADLPVLQHFLGLHSTSWWQLLPLWTAGIQPKATTARRVKKTCM